MSIKALFLNNYDMTEAWHSWKANLYPSNHLWGVPQMREAGIEIDILPHEKFSALNRNWRFQKLLNMNSLDLLALDQQWRAVARSNYDLIYSGVHTHTPLLARLRSLGLFRKPVVSVIYTHVLPTNDGDSYINGHDKLICLSQKIEDKLKAELNVPEHKLITIQWAVDVGFYDKAWEPDARELTHQKPIVMSAGKSGRDYNTLVESARNLDCEVQIFCSERSLPTISEIPDNVVLQYGKKGSTAVPYRQLLEHYRKANLVAIPVGRIDEGMVGYTSLLEAMVMGKPVVMTRHNYIDIDIEKEGIGIWADPGDIRQWRSAIEYLISRPAEAAEMGNRSRLLCVEKFDIKQYAIKVADVFREVFAARSQ